MKEALYICVHVPEFAAQALLRLRPDLKRLPCVVFSGVPPFEQICSLNAAAGRLGVQVSMTKAELESFTGICALQRSLPEEEAAKHVLLEAAGRFTPRVEVCTSAGRAFAMVLDMSGSERLFGSPESCVRRIETALHQRHFHVRLAASANFHAAVCLASSAGGAPWVVAAGHEAACLRKLPLQALDLTAAQAGTLAMWGVRTLGELAALREDDLVVRLGPEGRRLHRLARGEHPHLMVPAEPVFALEEYLVFETPVELLDSLLFVLGPMLDQLIARAGQRALALAQLTLRLGLDGGAVHERNVRPTLPVAQRDVLLKLLHLDLQAHPPPAAVLSLRLHCEPGGASTVQLGIFSPPLPDPLRLEVTLARIAAIVGEDRVGSPRLRDTHRADAFTMERFNGVPDAAGRPVETRERPTVALRRCRPPVEVRMRHQGSRPSAFAMHGQWYDVRGAYGPWRTSSEWWSADVWSREEWDVEAESRTGKLLCLVTHDRLTGQWHLGAFYD